jgi:hypothetical protein
MIPRRLLIDVVGILVGDRGSKRLSQPKRDPVSDVSAGQGRALLGCTRFGSPGIFG